MNRYHYFGIIFGRTSAKLSLDTAKFPNEDASHAAIWLGCNASQNRAWLQAGIAMAGFNDKPYIYIESGSQGHRSNIRQLNDIELGEKVNVKLRHASKGFWRLEVKYKNMTVNSHEVHVGRRPTIDALLEIFGKAYASGHIGRKSVHGRGK